VDDLPLNSLASSATVDAGEHLPQQSSILVVVGRDEMNVSDVTVEIARTCELTTTVITLVTTRANKQDNNSRPLTPFYRLVLTLVTDRLRLAAVLLLCCHARLKSSTNCFSATKFYI